MEFVTNISKEEDMLGKMEFKREIEVEHSLAINQATYIHIENPKIDGVHMQFNIWKIYYILNILWVTTPNQARHWAERKSFLLEQVLSDKQAIYPSCLTLWIPSVNIHPFTY